MNSDTLEELRQALNDFAAAFETIESIIRSNFDGQDKRAFLNAETFGPVSSFLQKGAGYEPANRTSQFHNMEDLLATCEGYVDFDDDDLTDDLKDGYLPIDRYVDDQEIDDEERRRDEKNGLYGGLEDLAN